MQANLSEISVSVFKCLISLRTRCVLRAQDLADASASRLTPVAESTAAAAAGGWLRDAAAAVAAGAPQLLRAARAPSHLAAAEAAVRSGLAAWDGGDSREGVPGRAHEMQQHTTRSSYYVPYHFLSLGMSSCSFLSDAWERSPLVIRPKRIARCGHMTVLSLESNRREVACRRVA